LVVEHPFLPALTPLVSQLDSLLSLRIRNAATACSFDAANTTMSEAEAVEARAYFCSEFWTAFVDEVVPELQRLRAGKSSGIHFVEIEATSASVNDLMAKVMHRLWTGKSLSGPVLRSQREEERTRFMATFWNSHLIFKIAYLLFLAEVCFCQRLPCVMPHGVWLAHHCSTLYCQAFLNIISVPAMILSPMQCVCY